MTKKTLAATVLALSFLFSTATNAAWETGVAAEYYTWTEYPSDTTGTPKESGPRFAIHLNWTADRDEGSLLGYRGKVYFGRVNYDTFTQMTNTPVTTDTRYAGMAHEGQLIFRTDALGHKLDYIGGMGWDYWRRNIGSSAQVEDYSVLYLRGGLNLDQPARQPGFHGGGGLKLPVWITEDAHLKDQGYYTNPTLMPEINISLYGELGYRFNRRFDISGYYDSWRFRQSGAVVVRDASGAWGIWQPRSSMHALGLRALFSFY